MDSTLAISNQRSAVSEMRLVDYLVYMGPHVIAGGGFQAAFDFGSTQATVYYGPDSQGLELVAFGECQVQLRDLDVAEAVEMLQKFIGADVQRRLV